MRTLGQLAQISRAALGARLGEAGLRLARRANGEDPHPSASSRRWRASRSADSDWAIANLEQLAFFLRALCDRLVRRVRLRGLALRRLRLELQLESGQSAVRELGLAAPTLETHVLLALARLALEREPPGEGVIGARAIATPDGVETAQLDLFLPPLPSPGELAVAIARIESLCGAGQVGAPQVSDTHRQDAATLAEFQLAHARRREAALAPDTELPPRGVLALRAVRPAQAVRVYGASRVEDAARSEAQPSEAAGGAWPSTRRAPQGGGRPPVYVSLQRGDSEGGRVLHFAGPWRLFGEWWGEGRFARDYWDVELSDGGLYRLYHNLPDDSWYVDGIYD